MGDEYGIKRSELNQENEPAEKTRNKPWFAIVGGAIAAAALGAVLSPLGDPVRPLIAPATSWVSDNVQNLFNPIPDYQQPDDFVVLVADFDGDDASQTQFKRIADMVAAQFPNATGAIPIRVLRYPRTLRLSTRGDMTAARANAEKEGRGWLGRVGGDLLIWGDVRDANGEVRVRYLTAHRSTEQVYDLQDHTTTEAGINDVVAPIVALTIAQGAVAQAFSKEENADDLMLSARNALKPLIEHMPPAFAPVHAVQVLHAYALLEEYAGNGRGDADMLRDSVLVFDRALALIPAASTEAPWPVLRANILTNRGNALQRIGRVEHDANILRAAVAAQRAAVVAAQSTGIDLQLLTAETNLGAALSFLAAETHDLASTQESLTILHEVAARYEQMNMPEAQASVLEQFADTALEQAKADQARFAPYFVMAARAYVVAGGIYKTVGKMPKAAHCFQNGGAAFALSFGNQPNPADAEAGMSSLQQAATIFERLEMHEEWAQAEANQGAICEQIAARVSNPTERKQAAQCAVDHFQHALTVFTEQDAPAMHAAYSRQLALAQAQASAP